jgi:hypothetical protein
MLANPIAELAARLIVDSGFADFASAKRKAAVQINDRSVPMPRDSDVETALAELLTACADQTHTANITIMRQVALELMQRLPQLELALVGPVASGIATEHFAIQLKCVTDDEKAVNIALINAGIDAQAHETRVNANAKSKHGTRFTFEFFEWPIDLLVIDPGHTQSKPRDQRRQVGDFELDTQFDRATLTQRLRR